MNLSINHVIENLLDHAELDNPIHLPYVCKEKTLVITSFSNKTLWIGADDIFTYWGINLQYF